MKKPLDQKAPPPQWHFNRRNTAKDFLRCEALHPLYDPRGTENRNRLQQKMHIIFVRAALDESHFVAGRNLKADLLENSVYLWVEYGTTILGWTDGVIQQHRDVMALVNSC